MANLREWVEARRRRAVIRRLRGHLAFFGCNTSGLSDDELERVLVDGMERAGKAIRQAGLTMDEAARSLAALGRAGA